MFVMMLSKNNLVDKVLSKITQKKRAMRLAFFEGGREGKIRLTYKTEIFWRFFFVATFLPQKCLDLSKDVFALKSRMQCLSGIPLVLGHEWADLQSPALPLGYRA
jgi:hypothetical protein